MTRLRSRLHARLLLCDPEYRHVARPGFGDPQIAALAGVAPIEASSAGGVRHRLSRRGNRRLNMLLYRNALAQQRSYAPAQAYLARRQQDGRTAREARRALKRQLVRRIWERNPHANQGLAQLSQSAQLEAWIVDDGVWSQTPIEAPRACRN